MTNTPETPTRIIPEIEAQIISQKLEYWDDGVSNFALQASQTLRELQEKLKNPTRENLEAIIDDLKAIFTGQRMIQDINAAYLEGLEKRIKRFAAIWLKENRKKEEGEND